MLLLILIHYTPCIICILVIYLYIQQLNTNMLNLNLLTSQRSNFGVNNINKRLWYIDKLYHYKVMTENVRYLSQSKVNEI